MSSNDVRKRLVEGYERTHDVKRIAEDYGVSESTVYKLARQMRETGSVQLIAIGKIKPIFPYL